MVLVGVAPGAPTLIYATSPQKQVGSAGLVRAARHGEGPGRQASSGVTLAGPP